MSFLGTGEDGSVWLGTLEEDEHGTQSWRLHRLAAAVTADALRECGNDVWFRVLAGAAEVRGVTVYPPGGVLDMAAAPWSETETNALRADYAQRATEADSVE